MPTSYHELASLILIVATIAAPSTGAVLASSIPVVIIFWSGQGIWPTARGRFRFTTFCIRKRFSNVTRHNSLSLLSFPCAISLHTIALSNNWYATIKSCFNFNILLESQFFIYYYHFILKDAWKS
jgi:hypothetical protein